MAPKKGAKKKKAPPKRGPASPAPAAPAAAARPVPSEARAVVADAAVSARRPPVRGRLCETQCALHGIPIPNKRCSGGIEAREGPGRRGADRPKPPSCPARKPRRTTPKVVAAHVERLLAANHGRGGRPGAEIGLAVGKPAVGARDLVVGLVRTPEAADLGDLDPGWVAEHARQAARMLPGGLRVLGVYASCDAAAFKASAALLASALREVRPGGGFVDRASGG